MTAAAAEGKRTDPGHWLVFGSHGQLGSALLEHLAVRGAAVWGRDLDELDVSDAAAVGALLAALPRPLVCVNAAAFTQVGRCEREPEAARRANAVAPAVLARACVEAGVRLVHVSTDYVFPGDGRRPYRESDPTGPRSEYGRSKLEGERAVLAASPDSLVVRTSWMFGRGRNFIAAVLEQAAGIGAGGADAPLRVVADQTGRPTYAVDLADGLVRLAERGTRGIVHVANDGIATWWDLARFALDEAGFGHLALDRIATSELPCRPARPAWSVLDISRAVSLGLAPRHWREAVSAYLASDHSPLLAGKEDSCHGR